MCWCNINNRTPRCSNPLCMPPARGPKSAKQLAIDEIDRAVMRIHAICDEWGFDPYEWLAIEQEGGE